MITAERKPMEEIMEYVEPYTGSFWSVATNA
jgi:hypothetical protein